MFEIGWARSTHGINDNTYRILVGRPEGLNTIQRHRHRWEDNIKIDLKKYDLMAWTGLIWHTTSTIDRFL
jgi:hypothetical protein